MVSLINLSICVVIDSKTDLHLYTMLKFNLITFFI